MADVFDDELPLSIFTEDVSGREEYFERSAKHTYRNQNSASRTGPKVGRFKPPKERNEISVNRLGLCSDSILAEIGQRNATVQNRKFWGWHLLSASDIRMVGCDIVAAPLPENRYHAHITFPIALDAEDR